MENKREQAARGIRQQPCVGLLIAVSLGSCLDRCVAVRPWVYLTAICICLTTWGCVVLMRRREGGGTWLLLAAVCLAGAARHHHHWNVYADNEISRYAPNSSREWLPAKVRGIVASSVRRQPDPFAKSTSTNQWQCSLQLSAQRLQDGSVSRFVSGKLRVFVKGDLIDLRAGDEVEVDGRLRAIKEPLNPAEWDRRAFARTQRCLAELDVPRPECVRTIKRSAAAHWWWALSHWTDHADQILLRQLGPERHPVASALLLGRREHLSREQQEDFLRTGTVHMLAISGLHVGVVAWGLMLVTKGQLLPERLGIGLVMAFTWLYALMTGAQAPVMRANLLVQAMCLSWWLRRRLTPLNSLALAALCVWARAPSDLFQVGPQLSFLAVLVLCVLRRPDRDGLPDDPLDRLLARQAPWYWRLVSRTFHHLRWSIGTSVAVWYFTSPLVLQHFHLIALATVVLNLLLWLPLTIALLSGLVLLLTSDWCQPLAWLMARICATSIRVFEFPVSYAADWPGSYFWSCGCGAGATFCFYLVWFVGLVVERTPRRVVLAFLLSGLVLVAGALEKRLPNRWNQTVRCQMLAVGHGTCVVVQFPRGEVWLYDCGRLGTPDSTVDMVSRYLWARGISSLNRVIVSHADADHYNLLPGLMERFSVQSITSSSMFWNSPQEGIRSIESFAAQRSIAMESCKQGDSWQVTPDVRVEVLHPSSALKSESDNANSIVLRIRAWGQIVLLPGDLDGAGLAQLTAQPSAHVQCAMAPHHGSLQGEFDLFMKWCRPTWLIISGRWDPYQPSDQELAWRKHCDRLLHTDRDGAVEVTLRPQTPPTVRPFRPRDAAQPKGYRLRDP